MSSTVSGDQAVRADLDRRSESAKLRDLIGQYREGYGLDRPTRPGEPWMGNPRRPDLPVITGRDLDELGANLRAAVRAAGLRDMLALERECPAWRVWRDSQGMWWATRHQRPDIVRETAGLRGMTGGVRTLADLRMLLTEQARLEAWAEEHHWQIPGEQARKELGLLPEPGEYRDARM